MSKALPSLHTVVLPLVPGLAGGVTVISCVNVSGQMLVIVTP